MLVPFTFRPAKRNAEVILKVKRSPFSLLAPCWSPSLLPFLPALAKGGEPPQLSHSHQPSSVHPPTGGWERSPQEASLSHFPIQEFQRLILSLKNPMQLACELPPGSPRNQKKLSANLCSITLSTFKQSQPWWSPGGTGTFKQLFLFFPAMCWILFLNALSNGFNSSLPRVS